MLVHTGVSEELKIVCGPVSIHCTGNVSREKCLAVKFGLELLLAKVSLAKEGS